MKIITSLLAITFCSSVYAQNYTAIGPADSKQEIVIKAAHITPSPRQLRWQELELTAFLHFGINTFTNREWGDGMEDTKLFNPIQLNAAQWVRTCKQAGIKQVIITAKHHDGFCLWPSRYTEHSVKNSPWKNGQGDVVKEVADACHQQGVGFGVYLSPWDRNNPDYGDTEKYNAYFMNQLTELLSNYGRVDEVWFDGANGEGPNGKKPVYNFNSWYQLIRRLQPQAVIAIQGPDVRWVGTETGRGRLTEWSVLPVDEQEQKKIADASQKEVIVKPVIYNAADDLGSRERLNSAKGLIWYPAETDVSIRPGWFYHASEDSKVKTARELMDIYFTSVGRNSVLLLNVPPNTRGLISENDVKMLHEWTKLRNQVFQNNLVKRFTVRCKNGVNNKVLVTDKRVPVWTTTGKGSTAVIEFDSTNPVSFNILQLQEDISSGQRIEKFSLEYQREGKWQQITTGTTVGYKRLLSFKPVTASKIRLIIASSRLNPRLTSAGLFQYANASLTEEN